MVKNQIDLLITHGCIVTLDQELHYYYPGSIAINRGRIVAVGGCGDIDSLFDAKKTIDANNKVVMPGLINCHTHACISFLRGMADDMSLYEWLDKKIWPATKAADDEITYYSVLLASAELIKGGTTCFVEQCIHPNGVQPAIELAGLRVNIADEKADFGDGSKIDQLLLDAAQFYDKYHLSSAGRIRVMFTAHAPYSCAPKLIKGLAELANDRGAMLATHLAETQEEVKEIYEKYGTTPTKHMDNLGFLGSNTLLAHSIWLTDDDIQTLAERQVKIAHDPTSNMKLTAGICPVPKLIKAGVTIGLGTDSVVSNNRLDMFEAMKTTTLLHKINNMDPTMLPAKEILRLATNGGAKSVGLENEIGSLTAGMKADLILVDFDKPHLSPHHMAYSQNIYSHLVYSATASDVTTTIVDGQILMEDRHILAFDERNVIENAQASSTKLLKQVGLL